MTDADRQLLRAFENCTIPLDQWNQRTHVSIAYLLLVAHPFHEALERLRSGIRRYNESQEIPDSATSGYNETTTVAMLHIIAAVIQAYRTIIPVEGAEEFCDQHPELMSKHVLRLFYSPQRRMDPRAKQEFLPPDLTGLPRCQSDNEEGAEEKCQEDELH